MVVVESAGVTDVGRKRKGNEDSLFVDEGLKLYIVSDGMGGHLAGEVASRLVVDTIQTYIKQFTKGIDVEEIRDSDATLSKDANRLLSGIHLANRSVFQISNSKESYRGMGATVSAVYFSGETLIAANVGDSPIYLIHENEIELISVPHTVKAEHAAIDPEGAKHLDERFSHMLTQAVGVTDSVKPDVCEIRCRKNDMVVISSDGLSDKIAPDEILRMVRETRPQKACQNLVDLANERGGDDNITTIVLKINKVYNNNSIINRIMNFFQNSQKQ